jgi:hypothetical protein
LRAHKRLLVPKWVDRRARMDHRGGEEFLDGQEEA